MDNLALSFLKAILMGVGATLTLDFWTWFLKRVFSVSPSSYCLVGRWILDKPEGIIRQSNIGSVPRKSAACIMGWFAHYIIGITFAVMFLACAGNDWLRYPTLFPAIVFGVATVLAPFFILRLRLGLELLHLKHPIFVDISPR